jgi:hypothetical protein
MPLIDIPTNAVTVSVLRRLAWCSRRSWRKRLLARRSPGSGRELGHIEMRFRPKGPFDVGELNCVIAVRTKLFASRLAEAHDRAQKIRSDVLAAEPGVRRLDAWLIL